MGAIISNIALVGTLKVWDNVTIPVYDIAGLNTPEKALAFVQQTADYYDSPLTAGTEFAFELMGSGYAYQLYNLAKSKHDEMIATGYNNSTAVTETVSTFSYGPSNNFTCQYQITYSRDRTFATSCIAKYVLSESNYSASVSYSSYNSGRVVSQFLGANGSNDVWARVRDGSKYKYYRVSISALHDTQYDTETACTISYIRTSANGTYMGGGRGSLYDIENIGPGATFEEIPKNPYEPGGESGEGGGDGNFDDTSDPIPDSSLPTLSSSNTGFTRIYNPSLAQVQDLAQYLWTDESVIQTIWNHIKQFMENPMDAIIGFNLVPCAVPNGGTKEFALMYIGTGVQMTVAANQFVDVDCGTCELTEYFGSALDYAPYTKISCFLPYIGTVELNVDEVMKTTLQVKYRIDICSGSCVAKILVNGNVLYQYSGHCAISIPISAADFSSYVSAAISVAKLAIGAAVGGGMGAAAAISGDPSQQTNQIVTTTQTTETARNPATGRQITMGTRTTVETRESPADQSSTQASFSGLTPNNIANTVGQIMSSKPHVEHSGSFSGNTGYLGVRRPYLIITRPNQCMPNQYQQFNGFPSMISQELSGLSGFTKVQQVQLTGMTATNPEQAEILEFLKSGVIL